MGVRQIVAVELLLLLPEGPETYAKQGSCSDKMIICPVISPILAETFRPGRTYDFRIEYSPPTVTTDDDTPLPSLFTALEKDLGLKLESTRASVDVLVIDHIQKPSEN